MRKRSSLPRHHLITNKVIRNTYALLALTLIFSGFMAYLGLSEERSLENWLWWFFGGIGLLLLMYPFKDTFIGIILVFAFTGWEGYWFGPYIRFYLEQPQGEQVFMWSAFSTGFIFIVLSAYAHITKATFSFWWGGFLCNCLGALCLISILVGHSETSPSALAVAYMGIVLFSAYILYDSKYPPAKPGALNL